jgi:chaperonin GroES
VGQNTPAETSRTMVDQGIKVYAAIFKRLWRSMKQEFRKIYVLNAMYLPSKTYFGARKVILQEDYLGSLRGLVPSADPNISSDGEKFSKLQFIAMRAAAIPGYNVPMVEKRILRALKIDAIDELYPGPDKVPPLPNPKLMVVQAKGQIDLEKGKQKLQQFALQLHEDMRVNTAKIAQLQAQAVKLIEEAKTVGGDADLRSLTMAIEALEKSNEMITKQVEMASQVGGEGDGGSQPGGVGGVGAGTGGPPAPSLPGPPNGAAQGSMGVGGIH